MPNHDIEGFRRGYEAINAAYRSGDVNELRPLLEESWDPDVVLQPAAYCQTASRGLIADTKAS